MRQIAKIHLLSDGRYFINGKVFSNFLDAHRELDAVVKAHRRENSPSYKKLKKMVGEIRLIVNH